MTPYPLPNHPSLVSQDPLGICSLGEETIPHFKLLRVLTQIANRELAQLEEAEEVVAWTSRIDEVIQDIAYSLHGQSDLNATGLQKASLSSSTKDRYAFRSTLFHHISQLDTLFPTGCLTYLSEDHNTATFSPSEMDCLLAHMFLGTLQTPPGNTWGRPGFSQYYDGKIYPVVANTAIPYLQTIVQHFIDGGYTANMDPGHEFTFHYSTSSSMQDVHSCDIPTARLLVTLVDRPTDPSNKKDAFVLVAANAQPGPGAGGTHEERLVGQSPALAIAALLTPFLAEDAAVVTSPFPVHASWEGHGRDARMMSLLPPPGRPMRRYIIADAIPLDLSHRQGGLLEGNMNREIGKLFAAFHGAKHTWSLDSMDTLKIEMPPWGCGAFGGSLKVKMPCMVMAAGLAGLGKGNLELLVPKERYERDLWEPPKDDVAVGELYKQLVGGDKSTASPFGLVKSLFGKSN